MQHKNIITKDGYNIDVFDDFTSLQYRIYSYEYVKNSFYKLGWGDSPIPERQSQIGRAHV